jgi:hypothetical protein
MRFFLTAVLALCLTGAAHAQNTPCSGKKGGISHCQGDRFVCNDGTVSASKKDCSIVFKRADKATSRNNKDRRKIERNEEVKI